MTLGGCTSTTTGAKVDLASAIPRGQSRIVVVRTGDVIYSAGAVNVSVDGAPLASIVVGDTIVQDVPAGMHKLAVTAFAAPGDYAITFKAAPGQTYSFEVAPRLQNLAVNHVFGFVGSAVHAQLEPNTGPYSIRPRP